MSELVPERAPPRCGRAHAHGRDGARGRALLTATLNIENSDMASITGAMNTAGGMIRAARTQLQGDPSGLRQYFVDFYLVVPMSARFSLGSANLAELSWFVGNKVESNRIRASVILSRGNSIDICPTLVKNKYRHLHTWDCGKCRDRRREMPRSVGRKKGATATREGGHR